MANITRTIRIRAGRRLKRQLLRLLFFTINLTILFTGIILRKPAYIITGALLLSLMVLVRLGGNSVTVTLNAGGIRFSCPFWKRDFPWNNIRSAGVYAVKNGEVTLRDPKHAFPGERLLIFVSLRRGYRPQRYARFNSAEAMHFRWDHDAWNVISTRIVPQAVIRA
ncbi:hypothetical protein ACFOTA_19050 [Chitinophaga sp. GCM10012297]|uniref:Uncharacterized protein n=1 Tax=Chitinophaga chungangae TaxID=2821488 RepID=A0ABS3YI00_9BACT|nr:hypothetical protein [Chitinophaga chungangae]MBO9154320.1 hypothetical protein [Chitinophaga chungangae]